MVIYCSGIGGIGLSAYAALQRAAGNRVRGSDRRESALLDDLRSQGIEVFLDQDGSHITPDIDLFVYTEEIPQDAPERKKTAEYGIRQVSYFQAVGELSEPCHVIAICGTHGKSSTTAMVAKVFLDAGRDPTVVVGTKSPDLGGRNWRKGASNLFIIEACEYRRNFRFLSPDTVALTTVDGDHFDAFGTLEEYREAFVEFLKQLPDGRPVIVHGSDAACRAVVDASQHPGIDVDVLPLPALGVPGEHMRQNARVALGVAVQYGISEEVARASLKNFSGTWRRMEVKGTRADGVTVIDDYAHHPAEIRASLQGIREAYPHRRILCVFQPHTHDRVLKLYNEFLPVFRDADCVLIPNVYAARSAADSGAVDLEKFVADIARESGVAVRKSNGLDGALSDAQAELRSGDVIITMGAGDVTTLAPMLLRG